MYSQKASTTVAVYSGLLRDRNYMRSRLEGRGFNAVCFESANICIDNFKSLKPEIVIARTESSNVGWRFLLSQNILGMDNPLVFASKTLTVERYSSMPLGVPLYALDVENGGGLWMSTIDKILREKRAGNGKRSVPPFIGESDEIATIRSMLPNLVASEDPVLVVGEGGVGKEMFSRIIAGFSNPDPVMVKLDCGIIEKDFSLCRHLVGIVRKVPDDRRVYILLSDIHRMNKHAQAEMLLFLEQAEDGASQANQWPGRNMRMIATASASIGELVKCGAFRKDLYYRLNVIQVAIPPLRERKADISLLMDYFTIKACVETNKCLMIPSEGFRERMYMHHWPGNVDELKGCMERVVDSGDENEIIAEYELPNPKADKRMCLFNAVDLKAMPRLSEIEDLLGDRSDFALRAISKEIVSSTEKTIMKKALELTNWNRKKAAQMLNISYKSMLNKMKAYDII